jgi:hypothetical protein
MYVVEVSADSLTSSPTASAARGLRVRTVGECGCDVVASWRRRMIIRSRAPCQTDLAATVSGSLCTHPLAGGRPQILAPGHIPIASLFQRPVLRGPLRSHAEANGPCRPYDASENAAAGTRSHTTCCPSARDMPSTLATHEAPEHPHVVFLTSHPRFSCLCARAPRSDFSASSCASAARSDSSASSAPLRREVIPPRPLRLCGEK